MAFAPFACPRCGANVSALAGQDYVTCTHCGTTTELPRQDAGARYAAPNAPSSTSSFPIGCAIGALALLVVLVLGAGLGLFLWQGSTAGAAATSAGSGLAASPAGARSPALTTTPEKPVRPPRLDARHGPLLADLNGDGAMDFVSAATIHEDKGLSHRYLAFDGKSGQELWRTKDLGSDALGADSVLEQFRLLLVDRTGKLTAYDGRTGAEQWSTVLGERLRRFCRAPEPDSVRVLLADERNILLDVKTGRQTQVGGKPKCEPANTSQDDEFSHDPADRSDPRAPRGVKSVVCGSVRVMGDQNFTLPEQCSAQVHVDPDRLAGMGAHALWQHDGGFLVLGFRKPGTRIPMLGFVKAGKLVWSSDVPESNPLAVREGSPDQVTLDGERIVTAYEPQSGDISAGVTAFDALSGRRLWNVHLPGKLRSISHIDATGRTVLISVSDGIVGLDADRGNMLFAIGDGN
ncbi:MAG TPA: PQQ-binding-like beta-propeller repeat protein [Polyangiaceae bacterium]|nr:PQQ-binding-like beta-propeller repeat protein [Polyangiaceae bacterium]